MNDMRPAEMREGVAEASPMMRQYLEIKAANPDSLLFYRMGDFYELFFGDSEIASRALGIALTRRGKHQGEDIPMCGVPVHAADDYLQKLIRLGHRVAVCEQLEDPAEARKRGYKSVVRRDVVRLVTPGTLTEDTLLDSRRNNYLCALAQVRSDGELALAWADISSGEFAVTSTDSRRLAADLARLEPGEVICPDHLLSQAEIGTALKESGAALSPLPGSRFDSQAGERRLKDYFAIGALDAHGNFARAEIAALGGLLDYILLTQVGRAPSLRPPRREEAGAAMLIDAATRANLELTRTPGGGRKGSLLAVIDQTITAPGARLLAERLSNPLTDPAAINSRLDDVGYLAELRPLREGLRAQLRQVPDMERALSRLTVGRGSPRDLGLLRAGLAAAAMLGARLAEEEGLALRPAGLATALERLHAVPRQLEQELADTLGEELPMLARDGGFVRPGFLRELDENRALRDETKQVIASLQTRYADETGIKSLKLRYNNILGYYVEVTAQNAPALQTPEQAGLFIHRQTMAGAMRFTTTELAGLEQRIAAAADRAVQIEIEIFDRLVKSACAEAPALSSIAQAIATLDVATGLAELAEKNRYVRPVVDGTKTFVIREGRHPIVEAALRANGDGSFVANPCDLSTAGRRVWLLTGPNMAGKSTYLRQNALIVILAQTGSYVPASAAHIGVVDRLFSRVGAADDLARGRSTFMVEMVETAAILNQATERSFVILDEIGRGTATFDGLSIAWAAVESLHDVNQCRALFATHYHELTALAARLKGLANATVKVREWQGDVVFLHEVVPGVADRSYGIQVAKLAGLPPAVVARASEVLARLEQSDAAQTRKTMIDDLPLFSATRPPPPAGAVRPHPLSEKLKSVLPDELSPREALELIYELKTLAKSEAP